MDWRRFGALRGRLVQVLSAAIVPYLVNMVGPGRGSKPVVLALIAVAVLLVLEPVQGGGLWGRARGSKVAGLVERRAEVDAVVRSVRRPRRGAVTTTVLHGAGGFGKTSLALLACQDRRLRRRHGAGELRVTLDPEMGGAELAAQVNALVEVLTGTRPNYVDPEVAGRALGRALDDQAGPPIVLVDNVWSYDQLRPFLSGGVRCPRLVTTRVPACAPPGARLVAVGRMRTRESRQVLASGVSSLDRRAGNELLTTTGGWPLLMGLANGVLRQADAHDGDPTEAAWRVVARLRTLGPTALDAGESGDRSRAVRLTLDLSLDALPAAHRARLLELSIFAEGADVPVPVVADLWAETGGLTRLETDRICRELANVSAVDLDARAGQVVMHELVREHLRSLLGADRALEVNAALVAAAATVVAGAGGPPDAWWQLPHDRGFLWSHLPRHLLDAGSGDEAGVLVTDLRWVTAKLVVVGAAAVAADLDRASSPRAGSLRRHLTQSQHLLGRTEPDDAVADILLSRLDVDPDWGDTATAFARTLSRPRLVNTWKPVTPPRPVLARVLPSGGYDTVRALAVLPDRGLLAVATDAGTITIWDVDTGEATMTWRGHDGDVLALAVAPDGSWLASGGADGRVRVWDLDDGTERQQWGLFFDGVLALAASPDGRWVAVSAGLGMSRVHLRRVGRRFRRRLLWNLQHMVRALAFSADGGWLGVAGHGPAPQLWRPRRPWQRWPAATLDGADSDGHRRQVTAMAISPDGSTLLAVEHDALRAWSLPEGDQRYALPAARSTSVAMSQGGRWFVMGTDSGASFHQVDDGYPTASLTTAGYSPTAMVLAHDSAWLATGSMAGSVHVWDVAAARAGLGAVPPVGFPLGIAVAGDGVHIASAGADQTVRIWDATTGAIRASHTYHRPLTTVAAAPSGRWFAIGGGIGDIAILDAATADEITRLPVRTGSVLRIAISQDERYLAAASGGGRFTDLWELVPRIGHIHTFTDDRSPLRANAALAFTDDSTNLAVADNDGGLRRYDLATGAAHAVRLPDQPPVTALALGPDDTWLVTTGSDDHVARVHAGWGPDRLAELRGHSSTVTTVEASPDSRLLATGGLDRAVIVWDTATWRPQAVIRVDGDVRALSWYPDSRALAVAGAAGTHSFTFHPRQADRART